MESGVCLPGGGKQDELAQTTTTTVDQWGKIAPRSMRWARLSSWWTRPSIHWTSRVMGGQRAPEERTSARLPPGPPTLILAAALGTPAKRAEGRSIRSRPLSNHQPEYRSE